MIEELKQAIVAQIRARVPVQTVWAECVAADVASGTMTATANGLEYHDVLLGLGADMTVPEPHSRVLLGLVGNKAEATWLIYAERIALRHLNGNVHGGLVKADAVAKDLATLQSDVNSLKQAFLAWLPVAGPTTDGGAGLKTLAAEWASKPIPTTSSATLQNTVVKHG